MLRGNSFIAAMAAMAAIAAIAAIAKTAGALAYFTRDRAGRIDRNPRSSVKVEVVSEERSCLQAEQRNR
jgi:hypothetical protein